MNSRSNRDLARQVMSLTRDPNFQSRVDEVCMYASGSSMIPEPPPPPPGEIFLASRGESVGASVQPVYGQNVPYPSRHGTFVQSAPPGPPGENSVYGSEHGIRGMFSKGESASVKLAHLGTYDQAMALLSRDETFNPLDDITTNDESFVSEVESGPYDPNAAVAEGIQRNTLYLLMKNDVMLSAKNVENMMSSAAFIWQNIYDVTLPMIRIPEKSKEFVFFKMKSMEDKFQALSMSQNGTLKREQKLFFMGKPTHIKDVSVAPLPFVMAQPGTRQDALDALMPLRGIPYEDQIKARSDSIRMMLKNVVLSARKSLNMPAGAPNQMARCFFDEPELTELVPLVTRSGFTRFTTIEFGYHPSTGEPVPGIRVYYGPDEAPLVYLLSLEDCTHISPAILKTVNDLFQFLLYEGFTIFDPKYNIGDLLKFRVLMNTSGTMIITVELALDDDFVGSFEEIVTRDDTVPSLATYPRALYQPVQEPPLIPEYPFMKENSLDPGPPTSDLMKYGGVEQLCRIRPVLQRFHHERGQALGVDGVYVTWYYVNERPVEWSRNSKIWHHACGTDFIGDVIMDVTLPMFPHICSPHFPHTQAFRKIVMDVFKLSGANTNSRVIILSEYLFLAEFFGKKCSRTIVLKNETTVNERDYLERTLPQGAIKFLSPNSKPSVELLEPGGDVVIVWGENRNDKLLKNIGFANYKLVVFVRDGLKRAKHDKKVTFASLHHIARCLFPYMALHSARAIDLEPQGNTMPALMAFFTKAPHAPKIPEFLPGGSILPMASFPTDMGVPPPPLAGPMISNERNFGSSQPRSVPDSMFHSTPQSSNCDYGFQPGRRPPKEVRSARDLGFQPSQPSLRDTGGNRDFGFQPDRPSPRDVRGNRDFGFQSDGPSPRDTSGNPDFRFQPNAHPPRDGKFKPEVPPPRDVRGNRDFGFQSDGPSPRDTRGDRNSGFRTDGPSPRDTRGNRDFRFQPNDHPPRDGKFKPEVPPARDVRGDRGSGFNPIDRSTRLTRENCDFRFQPSNFPPRDSSGTRDYGFKPDDPTRYNTRDKKPHRNADGEQIASICQYIMAMGGPDNLETMPLPNREKVCGWELLETLQKSIENQKRNGGVNQLPKWYQFFLTDNGFRVPYKLVSHSSHPVLQQVSQPKQTMTESEQKGPYRRPGNDHGSLPSIRGNKFEPRPPIGKFGPQPLPVEPEKRNHPTADHPTAVPPKKDGERIASICQYIMAMGGPDNIETMPLPKREGFGRQLLDTLQKSLQNQKRNTSEQENTKRIMDFIFQNGGHKEIENIIPDRAMPNWKLLKNLQGQFKMQKKQGGITQYPVWYHKYLMEYEPDAELHPGVTRPFFLTTSQNNKQLSRLDENTLARKQPGLHTQMELGRHIMENGGPSNLETMPLPPLALQGRSFFLKLLRSIHNQKTVLNCKSIQQLPMWYLKFLSENGFNAKELYPQLVEHPKMIVSGKIEVRGSPDRIPYPEDIMNDKSVQEAIQYIVDNGGPDCIETMPFPEVGTNTEGLKKVHKLKKSIETQRTKLNGKVNSFPPWYILFLMKNGYPVSTNQYVDRFGHVRKIPKDNAPLDPPPYDWSQVHPRVQHGPERISRDETATEELIDYIKRNGGHPQIVSMRVDRTIRGFKMLANLKQQICYEKEKDGVAWNYPPWYRKYLAEHEPHIKLPEKPPRPRQASESEPLAKIPRMDSEAPSGESASVQGSKTTVLAAEDSQPGNQPVPMDTSGAAPGRRVVKYDPTFICEYISKNGGHANVDTMEIDKTIEGWQLLQNMQRQNKSRKARGVFPRVSNWYRNIYIAKYEPEVVLPTLGVPDMSPSIQPATDSGGASTSSPLAD